MKSPFFSVAIPTRNRADLARRAISSVLIQDFADWELIVLDNSDSPQLTKEELVDQRCRLEPASKTFSMPENWERALDHASGEYLLMLSDKDVLIPSALERLYRQLGTRPDDIISYRKAGVVHGTFGFVQACSGVSSREPTNHALKAWFREVSHQHDAPMVYNSAVRREFMLQMRGSRQFFVGCAPDVASGIILCSARPSYTLLDRPLALSEYGEWSIGRAAGGGSRGAAKRWLDEFSDNPLRRAGINEGVVGAVAETLMSCKREHPAELRNWQIRWSEYVRNVLRELHGRRKTGLSTTAFEKELRRVKGKPYAFDSVMLGYLTYFGDRIRASSKVRSVLRVSLAIALRAKKSVPQTPYGSSFGDSDKRDSSRTEQMGVIPESIDVTRFIIGRSADVIRPKYISLDKDLSFNHVFALLIAINKGLDRAQSGVHKSATTV